MDSQHVPAIKCGEISAAPGGKVVAGFPVPRRSNQGFARVSNPYRIAHRRWGKGAAMADLVSIILAAGDGTRMRSATPKLLHPVGGMSIIGHVVRAAMSGGASRVGVVTSP